MLVIPAIDVLEGRCVRLARGEYSNVIVYDRDPAEAARRFLDCGVTRVHVVNLDAARGDPVRESTRAVARVVSVCAAARCEVEVGGGVRDVASALGWLDAGAALVILGSVAARDPELAQAICEVAGGRVLLGLDVRDGVARVHGWTEDGEVAVELLRTWSGWGAAGVVYTDTTRDGLLSGPDLEGLQRYRAVYGGPLYLSGGVSRLEDLTACAAAGVDGVVVGKALYEGRVDLVAALRAVAEPA
ncbi:MAG: 1-(5-phosphoribosyl)-5-[(5-phosphoribosylamino)methylideneamino] imidazole-4-carboxamide isomerase [Candidatus Dormiibacterota bacterium]